MRSMRGTAVLLAGAAVGAIAPAPASAQGAKALFAAANGSGNTCSETAPCTLARAIAKASSGATVHVRAGRYSGGYVLAKKLRLIAQGRVLLDASGSADGTGIHIVGPGGSGSVVQGFIVEKATHEGILVGTSPGDAKPQPAPVSGVVLRDNWVLSNNTQRGQSDATGECASQPPVPADCGGGIHLVWTSNALVENNVVAYNADGILLTDEFGPTSHNTIRNNRVLNNVYECGIVLAGHSGKAVGADGKLTDQAGVFDNLIENNLVRNNGVALSGAGVLLAGGAPGSAVYGNVVRGNTIELNGHSGVTVHQHVAGNLDANQIENNTIGTNNSLGDDDFAAAVDMQTTGILVASGAPPGPALPPFLVPSPISGTVISGNTISGDAVGIWTLHAPGDYSGNTFGSDVKTPISTN
jgi:parallel beta-helix repeat protein